MGVSKKEISPCPIDVTLSVIDGRWKGTILWRLLDGPMYNASIPSLLKAWIDQIVRLGKTVGHGPNGPKGLLARKRVVVITSRGASYEKGTAREAFDFQEPYLLHILAVIGLTDVTFIHAENQGREEAALCFAAAAERISEIAIDQDQLVASPAQSWRAWL